MHFAGKTCIVQKMVHCTKCDNEPLLLLLYVMLYRYSRREAVLAYWGMGLYWGKASSNNKKGHMIGHIKVSRSNNIRDMLF